MSNKGKVKTDYKENLLGASFAFAGMNFMVDPADLPIEGGQCVDLCNCDVDFASNISRRDGYIQEYSGNITSAWANSTYIYCIVGGKICRIINNAITPMINSPDMLPIVEFKQVNNITVYSDGVTIGMIEGDNIFVFSSTVTFG